MELYRLLNGGMYRVLCERSQVAFRPQLTLEEPLFSLIPPPSSGLNPNTKLPSCVDATKGQWGNSCDHSKATPCFNVGIRVLTVD